MVGWYFYGCLGWCDNDILGAMVVLVIVGVVVMV